MDRKLVSACVAAAFVAAAAATGGVVYGRQLGAREARERIAELLGAEPSSVRVKSVAPGPLGGSVVEAQVDLAFRMVEENGDWKIADVRLGANRWENVDDMRRAFDADKARRAASDLRALAAGVEAYRAERGFYPDVETAAELVDRVVPRFAPALIREDPWHRPLDYDLVGAGYRLRSFGPDGIENTPDDVVVTGGAGGERITRP